MIVYIFCFIMGIGLIVNGQLQAMSTDLVPVTPRSQSLVNSLTTSSGIRRQSANEEQLFKAIDACSKDQNDTLPLVSYLVTHLQANVNAVEKSTGQTPLIKALNNENFALVAMLSRSGADNSKCDEKQKAVIFAAQQVYKK